MGLLPIVSLFISLSHHCAAEPAVGRFFYEIGVFGLSPLSFYSTDPAKPQMVLSSEGLFKDGHKVCTWQEGRFTRSAKVPQTLVNCQVQVPFKISRQNGKDVLETPVLRKTYSGFVVPFGNVSINLMLPETKQGMQFLESAEQRAALIERFRKDPQLKELARGIVSCLKARDAGCLKQYFEDVPGRRFGRIEQGEAENLEFHCGNSHGSDDYPASDIANCLFTRTGQAIRDSLRNVVTDLRRIEHEHNNSGVEGLDDEFLAGDGTCVFTLSPVHGVLKVVGISCSNP